MFSVAKFIEGQKVLVEVVPSNWKATPNTVLWPDVSRKKFEKYLSERREPDASWSLCNTSFLKENLSHDEAESYVRKYIEESESESEDTSAINRKKSCLKGKKRDHDNSNETQKTEEAHFKRPKQTPTQTSSNNQAKSSQGEKDQMNEALELLRTMTTRMDILEAGQEKILEKLEKTNKMDSDILLDAYEYLPCDNASDLRKLEDSLSTQEGKLKLIQYLKTFGGKDALSFISRAMFALMTPRFAQSFSWDGAQGKNVFRDLNCKSVLQKFTISVFQTTEENVKTYIKNQLKNTPAKVKSSNQKAAGTTRKVTLGKRPREKYQPCVADYFNSLNPPMKRKRNEDDTISPKNGDASNDDPSSGDSHKNGDSGINGDSGNKDSSKEKSMPLNNDDKDSDCGKSDETLLGDELP